MKCPNCNEPLLMSERHGVEIDYCPQCRGIWLDRGELDKLLEYATNQGAIKNMVSDDRNKHGDSERYDYDDRGLHDQKSGYESRDYERSGKHSYPRKKKSFLSDFFDFD